ncbi:MAG: glycosyl hydrolase, family 88 [Paenibacillaceae bacterium]|jgi:unsaturated chondroitin disaccharide hydrolase|nr:glycosyl hydrolase, family 88 [Paenibacillaceae bacterium]
MSTLQQAWETGLRKLEISRREFTGELWEFLEKKDGQYFRAEPSTRKPFHDIGCWVASFYSGMELLAFERQHDLERFKWINRFYTTYHDKVTRHAAETMHDLGFLYSPYSVKHYKLTGDVNQRRTALKAAELLAARFVLPGGYIKAWGRMDQSGPEAWGSGIAIIDTMMNLPLLFWAAEETGNPFYRDIAARHADFTARLMVREDGSVYHAYRFDEASGEPLGGCNFCGFADESHWARGTAWAIYGFAIAARYTGNPAYLDTSIRLARRFLAELRGDAVPVWDFRLPPKESPRKDSSAAAIAACGFLELARQDPEGGWREQAERSLTALASADYLDGDAATAGMLKHSNGREVYTIYGDYFFMEALAQSLDPNYVSCW